MMSAIFSTYALPIIQSILASRIDSTMQDWIKKSISSDDSAFHQILMESFVSAVRRVVGDTPKIVKEQTEEQFDECRELILENIRQMEVPRIPAYINENLYNAFVEELNKRADAIPSINRVLLEKLVKQSDACMTIIQSIGKNLEEIKKANDEILQTTRTLMKKTGMTSCNIIPYVDDTHFNLPAILSLRSVLVSHLFDSLLREKAIFLYAGVLEGKTVASRLLAKRLCDTYVVIEIDLSYRNELNLEYVFQSYDTSSKYVFIVDGVKYDSDCYETFCELISRYKSDNWLFIINSYDKISDHIFSDYLLINENKVPALTQEEVNEMIPEELQHTLGGLVWGLYQGQPMLTNLLCGYLKQCDWQLSHEQIVDLFTFSGGESMKKKIKIMLRRTINDDNAYNLLNRLMVLNKPFGETDCAELAGINPMLRNPINLLGQLEGTWVENDNGIYKVSPLLRSSIKPDLLIQEAKDCYCFEANKLLEKGKLTPKDVLEIMNYLVKADDYDRAGAFYISVLIKLKEQDLLKCENSSLIKALWIDVPLPSAMSDSLKLAVRGCQLAILDDLKPKTASNIVSEIEGFQDSIHIDKELKTASYQAMTAYCLLHGMQEQSIKFQRKLLRLSSDEKWDMTKAKQAALVEMNNVLSKEDLFRWFTLYDDLGSPQTDIFSEGAIVVIDKLCAETVDNDREQMLLEIIQQSNTFHAEIFAVASVARLIDIYFQQNQSQKATDLYESNNALLAFDFGDLLVNYSYGLGLYRLGKRKEAFPYIEKAAKNTHINVACMVALNARCKYAQMVGDVGDVQSAVAAIKEITHHPCFKDAYGLWEKDAIYGTLAYALWRNGEYCESVSALLRIEHHLWESRNNQDDHYKDMSLRFSILVMFIHCQATGKALRDEFAVPDYCTFIKTIPNLIQEYKTVRNFTVEEFLYELAEKYIDEDTALLLLEHMLDFQKQDAKSYGHFLSVMVQAVPLCLKKGRYDIIEYIVVTALASAKEADEARKIDYEGLVLLGSLHFIVAYRAMCLIKGKSFDDAFIFDLMDKSIRFLDDTSETEKMQSLMLSANPNYREINNPLRKSIVALYNFKRVDYPQHLSLLWTVMCSMNRLANMPSAQKILKDFALDYALFLIKEYPNNFELTMDKAKHFFAKISHREGLDYARGIIQGLYFQSKISFYMSKELEEIVND